MSSYLSTGLRRPYPVAGTLEGIAGKRYPAPGFTCEQTDEVELQTRLVRSGGRLCEAVAGLYLRLFGIARRTLQAVKDNRAPGGCRFRPCHRNQRPEHGVGTDLHDDVHAQFRQGLYTLAEGHRLTRMPSPVCGIHPCVFIQQMSGYVAHQRHGGGWRSGRDTPDGRFEIIQSGLHQGAVISGAPPQSRHLDAFGLENIL